MTGTLAILQARMTSTRLPGKVLQPIAGEPMLSRCIERAQQAFKIDRLLVATSNQASDDPIAMLCWRLDVECFRGSLNDVLDRFHRAAREDAPERIVRLTADCPLVDPALIDDVVSRYQQTDCDYCSNTIDRTYPRGLDVEVFSPASLETAWREATDPYDREHVTPFLWRQPERFQHAQVTDDVDRSAMRWTVDEPSDLEFVRRVYERLYPFGPAFSREDVFDLLDERPEISAINAGTEIGASLLVEHAAA